jgi:hypothetical protein
MCAGWPSQHLNECICEVSVRYCKLPLVDLIGVITH